MLEEVDNLISEFRSYASQDLGFTRNFLIRFFIICVLILGITGFMDVATSVLWGRILGDDASLLLIRTLSSLCSLIPIAIFCLWAWIILPTGFWEVYKFHVSIKRLRAKIKRKRINTLDGQNALDKFRTRLDELRANK